MVRTQINVRKYSRSNMIDVLICFFRKCFIHNESKNLSGYVTRPEQRFLPTEIVGERRKCSPEISIDLIPRWWLLERTRTATINIMKPATNRDSFRNGHVSRRWKRWHCFAIHQPIFANSLHAFRIPRCFRHIREPRIFCLFLEIRQAGACSLQWNCKWQQKNDR